MKNLHAPIKLDILVPTLNRPSKLFHFLTTALELRIPGIRIVVLGDGCKKSEEIPGKGMLSTKEVVALFDKEFVYYIRNTENLGLAATLDLYYKNYCTVKYTMLANDKDEFISTQPIESALRKLEADPKLSLVMIPVLQKDLEMDRRFLSFSYKRMSSKEFIKIMYMMLIYSIVEDILLYE